MKGTRVGGGGSRGRRRELYESLVPDSNNGVRWGETEWGNLIDQGSTNHVDGINGIGRLVFLV